MTLATTLSPGQELSGYRILSTLPRRGMAVAYRAHSTARDRGVVLEILDPSIASESAVREALTRDAESITKRRHPNLAQVLAIEVIGGRQVIVSEQVEGVRLSDRIASGLVKLGEAPRIVSDVAAALTYVHDRELVHGDVTPDAIVITPSGAAVLTGLGIGTAVAASSYAAHAVGVTTPEYASPERTAGAGPSAQDDRYALVIVAYEVVTGHPPFRGRPPLAVALAHGSEPLPLPSALDPRIGEGVDRAVLKGLAHTPGDRFARASDFSEAFKRAVANDTARPATGLIVLSASDRAELARVSNPRRRLPPLLFPLAAAATIALVAGGAGIIVGSRTNLAALGGVAGDVVASAPTAGRVATLRPTPLPTAPVQTPAATVRPPVATIPVPTPPPVPTAYRVNPGDSLWSIAERVLGSGSRWPELYALNRALIGPDPDVIATSQTLVLPRR